MLEVSVGIPTYNEEANIGRLLERLSSSTLRKIKIREIIIIVSGCTDRTLEIVKECQKKDKRIRIFVQKNRQGKTAADNLFIREAKSEILVLESADTLPEKDCLEKLVLPFTDKNVGVSAARIIPLNDRASLSGYFSHLWWSLFHRVALNYFRAGEVMAFRRLLKKIPPQIGADEVFLTDEILAQGYKAKYVPSAIAYNMGPETIRDIILMRRRDVCLHYNFGRWGPRVYYPKTMDNFYVFPLFLSEVKWFSSRETFFAIACLFLEAFSRLLANFDFHIRNIGYQVWPRTPSTKRLFGFGAGNANRRKSG